MAYNWGPYYIVPTPVLKKYSGIVVLRERFDEALLRKELETLGLTGGVVRVTNPWYFRKQSEGSWIKVGESDDQRENFRVAWDTAKLENGKYEVLGMMHVSVKKGDRENVIARQNIVEVTIENRGIENTSKGKKVRCQKAGVPEERAVKRSSVLLRIVHPLITKRHAHGTVRNG